MNGLLNRRIFTMVMEPEVPKVANIMGVRFIITLNNCGTPDENSKVRYVAQWYNYHDNPYLVHDTITLSISSVLVVMSIAAVDGFNLFSHDVMQYFMQIKSKLLRKLFIHPKKDDRKVLGLNYGKSLGYTDTSWAFRRRGLLGVNDGGSP